MPEATPSPSSQLFRRATWAVLLAAAALRLWLALTDHSIYWPDELYQSLEQAHRLAFGDGIIPWEFRDGARNWILPGLLAALLKLAALAGVSSSLSLVALARGAVVLGSVLAIGLGARLAERLASARAGLVTALVLAVWPASVVFGYRTLSESVSAPLVVLSALLSLDRSPRRAAWAGLWITLATLLRYQNALFGLVYLLWLLWQRRAREALYFAGAGVAALLLGSGLLDWLSWGRPFHSLLTYVDFNLLRGGASTFGVEPFWYYAVSLWTSSGPALAMLAALAVLGSLSAPALGLAVLLDVLVHSLIPHKELRFLVPALPLAGVLVGLGAERAFFSPARRSSWGWVAATAAMLLGLVLELPGLTYRELGQYLDVPRGARRVWNADEEPNLMLARAGQQPDLCGLGVLGLRPAFTGAYTYLHRAVPLFYGRKTCGAEAGLNYLLVPYHLQEELLPDGYHHVDGRGWLGLFRREGGCAPLSVERLLDGAHDLGLHRPTATQQQDGSASFDLLQHSGNFTSGWGMGELIECKPARWAVGRRSVVQFHASAGDRAAVLRASVRAHPDLHNQHLVAALNGQVIFAGEVPNERWQLSVDTPPLRRGTNRLSFEWSETGEPEGDDTRALAALFESLELRPLAHDFDFRAGADDDEHFVEGFSPPELEGSTAFRWSEGPASLVQGRLDQPELPHLLTFTAHAMHGISGRTRVSLNGHPLRTLQLPPEWLPQQLLVPPQLLRAGLNRLRFEYEVTVAPAALSALSTDQRELSARFRDIALLPLAERSVIDAGTPEARAALLDGWSSDEREGERSVVWSDGPRARLRLWLTGNRDARLSLEARAYAHARPLQVEALLNGHPIAELSPGLEWQIHELSLPERFFAEGESILELRFGRTARPMEHEPGSGDARELALRLDRLVLTR